jgi:uncharacterized protein (TIGR02266 family)
MADDKDRRSGKDRRKLKRLVKRIPAAFECAELRGRGYIKNVSKGGLFLRTDALPAAGTAVRVLFHNRDGTKVEVSGTVAWNTSQLDRKHDEVRPGFGIFFDSSEDAYREFFEQLMLF